MKTYISIPILSICLIALPLTAVGSQEVNLELEPCINGTVSASGLYATQTLEDVAKVERSE